VRIPALVSRLSALLLIGVFLSGGGSMPVVDAISHGSGPGIAGVPHFEANSPTDSHRDFCSLGASIPLAAHLSPFHADIVIGLMSFPEAAHRWSTPRSADLGLLPQPRAPPSLSA
jgi:hypothetical protein